jgi:DNA-binding transcriptional ArsR family regulator
VTGKSSPSGPLQVFKAEFFKALGHPVRIRILEALIGGERSVQELQEALDLEQPIVSQHLAMLRAKNLVKAQKTGTTVRYTIRVASIGELLTIARRIFDSQLIDSQTMLRELRREGRRR